jgi:hypothetical protein
MNSNVKQLTQLIHKYLAQIYEIVLNADPKLLWAARLTAGRPIKFIKIMSYALANAHASIYDVQNLSLKLYEKTIVLSTTTTLINSKKPLDQ